MTIKEATDRLLQIYSVYGVGREFLIGLMEDGIKNYDLSVEAVFNGARMMLGQQLGVRELFSVQDVAKMLGTSEADALAEIEKAKTELLEQGADMSKYILEEPQRQNFILPAQKWTS